MTLSVQCEDNPIQPQTEAFIGLPTLMQLAVSGQDLAPIGQQLLERLQANPDDANAMMDLSIVMQLRGQLDVALPMQAEALQLQQVFHLPTSVEPPLVRLLAIVTTGELMANTPLEFLLQGSRVSLDLLYIGPDTPPPTALPEHDLLFIAVGESDRTQPLLAELEKGITPWCCPVLNPPANIARLSRNGSCALLGALPGIDLPNTVRIDRQRLTAVGQGEVSISQIIGDGDFPLIVRPVDSQAGRGLSKLDSSADIAVYLEGQPEAEFYVARFVDYRGPDGLFRKYRIVFIDGRPFVAHMAVSEHWMVHYLNAGMGEDDARREEEARFMATFDEGFARRHASALGAIVDRVGLDYFGIDCAETPDGDLLIFEVDSALVVHAMDSIETYPYKRPQMEKLFAAFQRMLVQRMDPVQP